MREASALPRVAPATRLGKFTLVKPIGEGGMAKLFLARAHSLGGFEKEVVLKQIHPRLATDTEFVARFLQEARLAATLQHPNIASVYDVHEDDGTYFYSMEYVRGRDLRFVLQQARERGRTLTIAEVISIIAGLCSGLHHAHTRADSSGQPLAIVHRDVSPANVLLSFAGEVKLADFGVAKARTSMVSTAVGRLRGKIPYMSPEQCRAEALDRRSDVYSTGVVLWESLALRRLHSGESEIAMLRAIADHDAAPITQARPDCDPRLADIVARALARSPVARFQTAAELQAALESFARDARLEVGPGVVARLLTEMFGDDPLDAPTPAAATPRGAPADATPPTGTLAPPAARPHAASATAPAHDYASDLSEYDPGRARRRWSSVLIGIAVGGAMATGGLYVSLRASATDRATTSEGVTAHDPAPAVAPGKTTPTTASESPAHAVAGVAAGAPPAPTVSASGAPPETATPGEGETAEPGAHTRSPAERKRRSAKRRRRKSRRPAKPTSAGAPEIDLDSALPPGFSPQ